MTRAGALIAFALLAGCATPVARQGKPVAATDGTPLGTLPRQDLAQGECGLFLWKTGEGARLLLMAKAAPPFARVTLDGRVVDLPRTATGGVAQDWREPVTSYDNGKIRLTLDLVIEQRPGLSGGAVIPSGSVKVDRVSGESFVLPVSGMLACR